MPCTIRDFLKKRPRCWRSINKVPSLVKSTVYETIERKDVLTPLSKGKEWLYELTAKFQPRTAACLLQGGDLMVFANEDASILSLVEEVNDQVISIYRSFWGDNPSDPDYERSAQLYAEEGGRPRNFSLPEPLQLAYYHRFDGLNVPAEPVMGIYTRLLPFPIGRPWESLDGYLGEVRLKRKWLPWFEERFPGIKPEDKDDLYTNFMMFLDTRPTLRGKEGDVFFVKNHIQDGVIYHIHDADIADMRVLTAPVEAIDRYCEHVLKRREDRFDFMPYSDPLNI